VPPLSPPRRPAEAPAANVDHAQAGLTSGPLNTGHELGAALGPALIPWPCRTVALDTLRGGRHAIADLDPALDRRRRCRLRQAHELGRGPGDPGPGRLADRRPVLDGWAHNTRPQLETFFTPWHAVFYSGFISVALWICWSVWRRSRVPAGYGPAPLGVAIFLLSGVGDMIWHLAFGIERDIAALLSPTHLGLFTGAFLIVTAPLRSQGTDPAVGRGRRPSLGQLLPAVGSVALAGSLCAFILVSDRLPLSRTGRGARWISGTPASRPETRT